MLHTILDSSILKQLCFVPATSSKDLELVKCHEGHQDEFFLDIFTTDDQAQSFTLCHPKDTMCQKMSTENLQTVMYAGTLRSFFGVGTALQNTHTDCVDIMEYYSVAFYWAGMAVTFRNKCESSDMG